MPIDPERGRTRSLAVRAAPALDRTRAGDVQGWHIDDVLGCGGFGTVYAVTETAGARRGALKILHPHLVESGEMVARVLREAEVIRRLRHPHVVELLDAGVDRDGTPFLVMELLDGTDLDSSLAAGGRLAPAAVLALVEPLCAALAAAHELGIVHRDVKASNVFVDRAGRVVLLDFGIAKLASGIDLTASRQAVGTPACMAPEQIRCETIDARTDVYGLGALVFHLLTGKVPFEDVSVTMSQYMHLHARRPQPSAVAPVSAALDELIARAMSIDPRERHPGPLAFLAALRAAVLADADVRDEVEATALLVSAPGDAATLVPRAERALAPHGFRLVLDLGDAALFVAPEVGAAAARAVAIELHGELEAQVIVHRGPVALAGGEPSGGALLDVDRWDAPLDEPGVIATAAALDDAAPDERWRRLR